MKSLTENTSIFYLLKNLHLYLNERFTRQGKNIFLCPKGLNEKIRP